MAPLSSSSEQFFSYIVQYFHTLQFCILKKYLSKVSRFCQWKTYIKSAEEYECIPAITSIKRWMVGEGSHISILIYNLSFSPFYIHLMTVTENWGGPNLL